MVVGLGWRVWAPALRRANGIEGGRIETLLRRHEERVSAHVVECTWKEEVALSTGARDVYNLALRHLEELVELIAVEDVEEVITNDTGVPLAAFGSMCVVRTVTTLMPGSGTAKPRSHCALSTSHSAGEDVEYCIAILIWLASGVFVD